MASPSHRICLSDDVEVGVSDPCYIYGSQTLMFINGGYISAVTGSQARRGKAKECRRLHILRDGELD